MSEHLKSTMSVKTMGKLLGLKKVDSYWLVHKEYFQTVTINGRLRVVIESFEEWYSRQIKYHKVTGEEPGEKLRQESYSPRDIAELFGITESSVYDLIHRDNITTITVDGWMRVLKEDFDSWYKGQRRYRLPEDRERDRELEEASLSMPEMARILDVPRNLIYHLLETKEGREKLEIVRIANRRRVTKDSFEKWYAGQTVLLKPEDRVLHPEAKNVHYADCVKGPAGRKPASKKSKKNVPQIDEDAEFLTPEELAYLANVSKRTVFRWIRDGKIPGVGISNKVARIPREDARQFLVQRLAGTETEKE